jgi:hypothetical protein
MPNRGSDRKTDTGQVSVSPVTTSKVEISPKLVQQVTERVYALMLQELKTNFERKRICHWSR